MPQGERVGLEYGAVPGAVPGVVSDALPGAVMPGVMSLSAMQNHGSQQTSAET